MIAEKTKVIFRVWGEQKDIIAIFPEEPGTISPYTCMSYMHIGQHGACNPDSIIACSSLAKKEECDDLFEELTSIGYSLQVIQRHRQSHFEKRKQLLVDFTDNTKKDSVHGILFNNIRLEDGCDISKDTKNKRYKNSFRFVRLR